MIQAYVSLQTEEKKASVGQGPGCCWSAWWWSLVWYLNVKPSPLYVDSTSTIRHSRVPRPSLVFTLLCIILNTNQRTTTTKKKWGRPGNEASTQLYICDGGSSLESVFAWLCKNSQKRSGEYHHKNDITMCMNNEMHWSFRVPFSVDIDTINVFRSPKSSRLHFCTFVLIRFYLNDVQLEHRH